MIDLFTKSNCSYCVQAKNLLNREGQAFREIPIYSTITIDNLFQPGILSEELKARYPDAKTAPVVVINGQFIGGYQELKNLFESSPQLLTE